MTPAALLTRWRRRLDLLAIGAALIVTALGGVAAVALPNGTALVVAALGTAIVLMLLALFLRQRSGGRLSAAAFESALAATIRAVEALETRADRMERSVRLTRTIARSADELPAWIALAATVPIADAALTRGVDPRTLLALVDRLRMHDVGPVVLIIADGPIGAIAARTVLHVQENAQVVVLTSTVESAEQLRGSIGRDPRASVRAGTLHRRSFGRIAGPWFAPDDLHGLDGVRLVIVAGPSAREGAAARHAVAAGVLEHTERATLIVDTPDESFVSRAVSLWAETAPEGTRVHRHSPWVVDVDRSEA